MPCVSDYMEATARETESRNVAGHIIYAFDHLGRTPSDEVIKASEEYYGNVSRVDEFTDILCRTINQMSIEEQTKILYDGRNPTARKLADWWDGHKDFDTKRMAVK